MAIHALPWRTEPFLDEVHIVDANGNAIAYMADHGMDSVVMPPAFARTILQAVNAHDDLLAACKLVIRDVGDGGPSSDYVSAYTTEQVKAAIAKAEGGAS